MKLLQRYSVHILFVILPMITQRSCSYCNLNWPFPIQLIFFVFAMKYIGNFILWISLFIFSGQGSLKAKFASKYHQLLWQFWGGWHFDDWNGICWWRVSQVHHTCTLYPPWVALVTSVLAIVIVSVLFILYLIVFRGSFECISRHF